MPFVMAWESALLGKLFSIAVRSEQTIPQRQIGKIKPMHVELMMDRMQLRRLDKVSNPSRRPDIGMVEEFSRGREEIEPERAFE